MLLGRKNLLATAFARTMNQSRDSHRGHQRSRMRKVVISPEIKMEDRDGNPEKFGTCRFFSKNKQKGSCIKISGTGPLISSLTILGFWVFAASGV